MNGRVVGPGPGLLRHERQERGEQPQLHVESNGQCRLRGGLRLRTPGTVGAFLDQLQIVVAEGPEEGFRGLKCLGVVEGVERLCTGGDNIRQRCQQRPVDRVGDGGEIPGFGGQAENELARVQDLHGQPAPHLHLRLVERRIHAGTGHGGAPADRVGAETLQDVGGNHHVALGLGHLLAVRVGDETRDGGAPPRQRVVLEIGAHDPGEQPGADDVVALRGDVHRESEGEQFLVTLPPGGDLRGQR